MILRSSVTDVAASHGKNPGPNVSIRQLQLELDPATATTS